AYSSAESMRISPESTLWIGQALAICSRRSRCCASSLPNTAMRLRIRLLPSSGLPSGLKSSATSTPSSGQSLRAAYIFSVIAVQAPSAESSSRCGSGPALAPPCSSGSSASHWWPWSSPRRTVYGVLAIAALTVAGVFIAAPVGGVVSTSSTSGTDACATFVKRRRLASARAVADPVQSQFHRRTAMDIVFIEDLRIDAVIGIYDWERRVRQTLAFDIEMAFDNTVPAASDDIAFTLNYKDVSKRLIDYVGASSFGLVETLAERCAAIIREEFGVAWVRLKLSKPGAVRGAKAVGVRIERGTRPD